MLKMISRKVITDQQPDKISRGIEKDLSSSQDDKRWLPEISTLKLRLDRILRATWGIRGRVLRYSRKRQMI